MYTHTHRQTHRQTHITVITKVQVQSLSTWFTTCKYRARVEQASTIIIDGNFYKINPNIFVGGGLFFSQEEIKLFVRSRLVVRVWCQHYDNSKAQLILATEAGAWWWVAAGSNMSGQGQLTYQVRNTDRFMCLMCVLWRWDSLYSALTVTLHYHCPLSTQLNTATYLPSQTPYPGQQSLNISLISSG